jgi:predicted dehydrogenase
METKMSRRNFLHTNAMVAAGLTIVPSSVLGKMVGKTAPSDKLNIAGVGSGGKGIVNIRNMKSENIVALCDVDWGFCEKLFAEFPDAKKFYDYREMFDQMGKSIDGVVIATPDHTHALVAGEAIIRKKHVYLQKPLTHSVYESRLLTKLAEKYQVCSQMGDEGASGKNFRLVADAVWSGLLGEVKAVEACTNRPIWPQGMTSLPESQPTPSTLRWDLYIGPTKMRPYNKANHPFVWRGWWDFGTGALGDMACHIIHPIFHALNLGIPDTIQSSSTTVLPEAAPHAEVVRYTFPARGTIGTAKTPLCEMTLDWYDGGLLPRRPKGLPDEVKLAGGATIYHGTKDTMIVANRTFLLSGKEINVTPQQREIEISHEMDWVRACKENAGSRVKPVSDFGEAGPLNEMIVAGVAAVRLQGLGKTLQWDGANMKFTNITPDETIKVGDETVNAQTFAAELIKHTYHNGFKLVDMP